MRPVNPDGTPWGGDAANFVLQDLNSKAIADLNARDEHQSRGRMNKANRYTPYKEKKREDGTGSTFVVDPVLSEIKHTGAETTALTQSRWAEFCEQPKDEKPYIEKLLQRTRTDRLSAMKAAGSEVQASLAPIPEAEMPVMPPSRAKKKEPALIG